MDLDVLIIGAGFSGLCALARLRELGFRTRVVERGDAVGGTWLWNRYPGARCDIESVEYSFSFSEEVQQEWTWSEVLPAQPEVERYLNFVADRLDLRRDIRFGQDVTHLLWDEGSATWTATTADGGHHRARFVIAATGILSAPLEPDLPGADTFAGSSLLTSRFPRAGFDVAGRRVGIVGTGSTGVQAIPVLAEQASHLTVFQRSAAYTLPSNARSYEPGEFEALRADYPAIRAAQRRSFVGAARISAFSVITSVGSRPALLEASPAERRAAIDEHGVAGALLWSDVLFDPEAGRLATELYGRAVARIVEDPETAASLVPRYPFGCKRPIIDSGYYETFNRPNVTLVDLHRDPIVGVTPTGVETASGLHELDVIVYATGFDAITGALSRMDVRGRRAASLAQVWADEGPVSYLGLAVAGFPNLFTVQGPASPALTTNFVSALEHHVDWMADCLVELRRRGAQAIEAEPAAQLAWTEEVEALVAGSVVMAPSCDSWWNGANVAGKARRYLSYAGGLPAYRDRCQQVVDAGYQGFTIT